VDEVDPGAVCLVLPRDFQFVAPNGSRDKLLRGHAGIEFEAELLSAAVLLWDREREFNWLPGGHGADHHWALAKRCGRRADARRSPDEAPTTDDLTLVLAFEAISAWRQQQHLPNAWELDTSRPKLDQERPLVRLVRALRDVDGHPIASWQCPVKLQP